MSCSEVGWPWAGPLKGLWRFFNHCLNVAMGGGGVDRDKGGRVDRDARAQQQNRENERS